MSDYIVDTGVPIQTCPSPVSKGRKETLTEFRETLLGLKIGESFVCSSRRVGNVGYFNRILVERHFIQRSNNDGTIRIHRTQ